MKKFRTKASFNFKLRELTRNLIYRLVRDLVTDTISFSVRSSCSEVIYDSSRASIRDLIEVNLHEKFRKK